MSKYHSRNKKATKKIKLDKGDENVGSIAEYKRCAILKFCNEKGIKKNQLDELSISEKLHKLGFNFFYEIGNNFLFFWLSKKFYCHIKLII